MYHAVLAAAEQDPAVLKGHVHAEALDRHLRWLSRFATVVSFSDAVEAVRAGERLPGRTVIVTFDDGLWNQAEFVLPLLERYEVPAVFFVATDHIGSDRLLWFNRIVAEAVMRASPARSSSDWLAELREEVESDPGREPSEYVRENLGLELPDGPQADRLRAALGGMTADQVSALARSPLVEIGGHTVSHPRLVACRRERIDEELLTGRRVLETLTGSRVRFFAYPEGGYDATVVEAARRAGFEAAAAVEPAAGSLDDVFRLPRLVINRDSSLRLLAKCAGLVGPFRKVRRAFGLSTPSSPQL